MVNPFVPRDVEHVNRGVLLETLTWHRAMIAALKDDASERAQKIRGQVRQGRKLIVRELERRDGDGRSRRGEPVGNQMKQRVEIG